MKCTEPVTADLPVAAVNYHVWQPCNMRCRFCFGRFRDVQSEVLPKGHLPPADAALVVRLLAGAGFKKITFAGGEPFLCPWLLDLIDIAKQGHMTTSVVTNGSMLTEELFGRLRGRLDWLAISIDSMRPETLSHTGRVVLNRPLSPSDYLSICQRTVNADIRLKINTVVTRANWREDLGEMVAFARPLRWKIMQALPMDGQNSDTIGALLVTSDEFESFVQRHLWVEQWGVRVIAERNVDMIGSYVMVDPAGRFVDNTGGAYRYSRPIVSSGVRAAISEVTISRERFLARGGLYDWEASETQPLEQTG